MAAQIRLQLSGTAGPEGAAAELASIDLTTCDPDTVASVLAAAAAFETPSTTVGSATVESTSAAATASGPAAVSDALSGGGIHQVTSATPGIRIGNSGITCLEYRELRSDAGPFRLVACTDAADFDVTFDLAAGSVAGTVSLDLACPGFDRCLQDSTATGSVQGTFGPLAYGEKPSTAPADFPFPADHWYDDSSYWIAGGPIQLDVAISGERTIGGQTASGSASTTITGWVESRLYPASGSSLDQVTTWNASIGISLDYPEDVDPYWYLWTGFDVDLDDPNVPIPPWEQD